MSLIDYIPFINNEALFQFVALLIFYTLIVAAGSKYFRSEPLKTGFVVSLFLSVITGNIGPFITVIFFFVASYMYGRLSCKALKLEINYNDWTWCILIGAGLIGTIIGILAHFPVNYKSVYLIVLMLPVIFEWKSLHEILDKVKYLIAARYNDERQNSYLDMLITVFGSVYFTVALMPELSHDALASHLFIPSYVSQVNQWGFDVNTYVWAVMPLLADWIFTISYMLGGETASRIINIGFLFILCKLIYNFVVFLGGNKTGAKWTILLFLSMPLTFTESSSLYVEVIWASFIISGVLAIFKLSMFDLDQRKHILFAGILFGFAFSTKVITATIIPPLLFVLLLSYKKWFFKETHISLFIGLLFFCLVGMVPYVTAWVIAQNPVFPFFNSVFKSPYYFAESFNNPRFNSGLTIDFLYQMIFNSGKYLESQSGVTGLHWITIFLPSIVYVVFTKNARALTLVFVSILTVVIVFKFQSYLRYIFPSFILLTVVIGIFVSRLYDKHTNWIKVFLPIAVLTLMFNILFLSAGAEYRDFPIKSILTDKTRLDYLENRLPIRNSVQVVNQLNIKKSPVAVFSHPLVAGLSSDAYYPSWYNHKFNALVRSANTERAMADMLRSQNIEYVILDNLWGDKNQRQSIIDATEEVLQFGNGKISVRKLRKEYVKHYQLKTELLQNPKFLNRDGWSLSSKVTVLPTNEISVTASKVASQVVPVIPGNHYIKAIVAKCGEASGQGRLQINWLDKKSEFISVDINVFDCNKDYKEHLMSVQAPKNATMAVIYAAAHTELPIVIKEIHFYNE